jgi:hypothetical protein
MYVYITINLIKSNILWTGLITSANVILKSTFATLCPGDWIDHGTLLRPASSPYLTLLDFSLWGSVKDAVDPAAAC